MYSGVGCNCPAESYELLSGRVGIEEVGLYLEDDMEYIGGREKGDSNNEELPPSNGPLFGTELNELASHC